MIPDTIVGSDLQSAVSFHQSGQLKQAAVVCKQVLKTDPENSDALHLLGLVFHHSGQFTTAVKLIKRALKVSPNQPDFLFDLANALKVIHEEGIHGAGSLALAPVAAVGSEGIPQRAHGQQRQRRKRHRGQKGICVK